MTNLRRPSARTGRGGPPAAPGHLARQEPTPRLDDQLCFALYSASRAVTAFYRPLLDQLGLTYPQDLVLLVLWERGTCLVKDLAQALELDYGTLSPLLRRLEATGLVRRKRRADDQRSDSISLSEKGLALRVRCEAMPARVGAALALRPGRLETLRAELRRLGAAAEAASRALVPPTRR